MLKEEPFIYEIIVTKKYDKEALTSISKRKCKNWEEVKMNITSICDSLKFDAEHEGAYGLDSTTIEFNKLF